MTDAKKTYDVAVLGWWYGKNYGSIMTYYGLNRAIDSLGKSVLMVHEPLGYNGYRVNWPDDILSMDFARRIGYDYTEQSHYSDLPKLNDVARTFVVGSDQLWNPLIGRVNDDLFLDFVSDKNDRVAYATSFGNRGTEKFKPAFVARHAANLQKFKAISVRENYAISTAADVFGAKASLVVDPVFLLPREHYADLAEKATFAPPSGDYMTVFFLDPTEDKRDVALRLADKLGFEKIVVVPNPDEGRDLAASLFADDPRVTVVPEDAPENFLRAYRDSSYVITDSFHGSAFAAIFEKPFSSIYNAKRGADRFKNLLSSLGFGETRRIRETDTAEDLAANPNATRDIDFTTAREYITTGRETSLAWLKDALDPDKKATAADPGAQKLAAAPPEPQKATITAPGFAANDSSWKISKRTGRTVLTVTRGQALPGKHAWVDLPERLFAGGVYDLTIDWTPRTESSHINLHLRDPKTGTFEVIGGVEIDSAASTPRKDTVRFRASDPGFSQLMIGALHFTGRHGGVEVRSITVQTASGDAPGPVAGEKAPAAREPKGRSEHAIPSNTPDRELIVLNVLNDPYVQDLKARLLAENPRLSVYVGRELKEYTNNKVGGPADVLTFPRTAEEIKAIVDFALENDVPYTVLGRGSNVIVRDGGIRGIVIVTTELKYFSLENGLFTAGAGSSFIEASYYLLEHGLSTLEWASGIPGTIGGAVFMNAGTNVSDIRATIRSVTYLDDKGRIKEVTAEQISWGKRYTTFQDHPRWIILEATFATKESDRVELSKKMLATVQVRERHFPLESPNHGSTFKWWRAPRLITQAGLIGYRIGGVQISTKQPGFFVNVDRATASDYEALIDHTIAKVYEFSGFLLEPEVEFIGERPHRYERYTTQSAVTDLEKKAAGPQA